MLKHCEDYDLFHGALLEEQLPEAMRNMPRDCAAKFAADFEEKAGAGELADDIAQVAITVFGPDSTIDAKARPAILSNYMDIIPEYYEGKDDYGINAAHYARIVFEGLNGFERAEPYLDDERIAITAAVEITEAVFPIPREEGYPNEGYIVHNGRVQLTNDESVKLLIENVGIIDQIKDVLMNRKTFHPNVVAEAAKNGALAEGSL